MASSNEDNGRADVAEKKFLAENIDSPVNIFLINGTKIFCKIKSYDDFSLVVSQKSSNLNQLIYKTAVASIVPQ